MIASLTSANKFKFTCPVLGIVRDYYEATQDYASFMKGEHRPPAIIRALIRSSKDPIIHMIKEEQELGRAIYFTTDENAAPGKPSQRVLDRIKSIIIPEVFMGGCTQDERDDLERINGHALPVDSRDHLKTTTSKSAQHKPQSAAPKHTDDVVITSDYSDAITKAAAREKPASAPKPPAPAITPPKPVSPASAAPASTSAPAPKLSLLEMAKRMKEKAA